MALNRAKLPFGARKAHPMTLDTYDFKTEKKDYNVYWDVRKGLIPIVGGARETGRIHSISLRLQPDLISPLLIACSQVCLPQACF